MIYLITFGLLFLFSLTRGKKNKFFFKLFFLFLLLLTCFRGRTVGIDTSGGYYENYLEVLNGNSLPWMEASWTILNRISISLGMGYPGVLTISGFLTLLPVGYVINKKCDNRCFALALFYGMYFVLYSFNLMRQCIAISFSLLAVFFYSDRKFIKSGIWLILGILFHKSALIVLAIIPFLMFRFTFARVVIVLVVSFVAGVLLSNRIFVLLSGKYATNLLVDDGYSGFRDSILMPAIFTAAFNAFFLFTAMLDFENLKKNHWFLISLLGVIVMNLTMRLGQGTRIVLYFSLSQVVFLSNYISRMENKRNKPIIASLLFLYLAANFFRILNSQWDSLLPYVFFWN